MLWTPSDGVNIFIVFLLLQSSVFLLLCGILPQSVGPSDRQAPQRLIKLRQKISQYEFTKA